MPDGEWYLHLFAPEQPDWNWRDPRTAAFFDDVLRFWFDRGVRRVRIDVAHGLVKAPGLPDLSPAELAAARPGRLRAIPPACDQEEVHEIYRRWRTLADSYGGPSRRALVGEVNLDPARRRPLHPPRRAAPGVRVRLSHRAVGRRRLAPGRHGAARDPAARRRCRDVGGGEPRRRPHSDPVCTARSAAGRGAGARGAAGRARAARRRVPVPGPGAGSARGRRPRVRPPGPGAGHAAGTRATAAACRSRGGAIRPERSGSPRPAARRPGCRCPTTGARTPSRPPRRTRRRRCTCAARRWRCGSRLHAEGVLTSDDTVVWEVDAGRLVAWRSSPAAEFADAGSGPADRARAVGAGRGDGRRGQCRCRRATCFSPAHHSTRAGSPRTPRRGCASQDD